MRGTELFNKSTQTRAGFLTSALTSLRATGGVVGRQTPAPATIFESRRRQPLSPRVPGESTSAGHTFSGRGPLASSWLRCALLIGLILALAPSLQAGERKETKLFRALGWAHFGLQAGDYASTEAALASGAGRELNPMMQDRWVRAGSKPALALASNYGTARLYQSNPKLALWMRVGICVGYGYIVAHNLRIANQ